jgi:hypothetical protein
MPRGAGAVNGVEVIASPAMTRRILPLISLALLTGCGAASYVPRPSPRIQVTSEGSSLVMMKNGRAYPFNMFGGALEEAVQGNAQAEAEAKSYRSKMIAGFVLNMLGSVTGGVGAGVLVGNEAAAEPKPELRIASITMVISGLVFSVIGSSVQGSAQPHVWNAINIYNDGLPAYPAYPGYPAYPAYPGYPAAPGYTTPPGFAPVPVPGGAPVPGVPGVAPVPPPAATAPAPMPAAPAPFPAPSAPVPAPLPR